ncbi:hypothetical protein HAHE_05400 [Haloferula helveola]|uniref:Uncharacterized protein n=1 Tax=Haloferula helveola TaxID=490095 RepID=A0ABN6GZC6_9BACT|nr:hypothetical protein HAHE_05400 [Haloferula helveola]
MKRLLLIPIAVLPFFVAASCKEKTPEEKAAEAIEDAVEEIGDAIEEATD